MKVLYCARLFSGLERSIRERRWVPTGVPTIYRVIEQLAAGGRLSLLLCAKDGHTTWSESRDLDLRLDGLPCSVRVLASTPRPGGPLRRLGPLLREIRHALTIAAGVVRERPDLIYIDHGNIWAAGLIARVSSTPVVFRVMGVYPAMREALVGRRLAHRYLRWCYRAPYAAVICSQDGSGVEPWLARAIRSGVPVHTLLNGVDDPGTGTAIDADVAAIPADRVVVLFLGKLEHTKGARQFADGFLAARRRLPSLHALMIGTGSLAAEIRARFRDEGLADALTIRERLPHAEVLSALRRADIYVSLNRFGNLSNANLEAMRVGIAMVFPASQPATSVDLVTDRLIPPDAAWRIGSADDTAGLAEALLALGQDGPRRRRMAGDVRRIAEQSIGDWDSRIRAETQILSALVAAGRDAASA